MTRSIDVFYEVGIKLGFIIWRSLLPNERDSADDELADVGYKLIKNKRYRLAQKMLEFAKAMPQISSDKMRRIFTVNLANAHKLDGNKQNAEAELISLDWTAASLDFQISIAAIRDDEAEVIRIMEKLGPNGELAADAYYSWPVFENVRQTDIFRAAYVRVFGVPFELYEARMEYGTKNEPPNKPSTKRTSRKPSKPLTRRKK